MKQAFGWFLDKNKEKYPESSMAELAEIISSETEKPISKKSKERKKANNNEQ